MTVRLACRITLLFALVGAPSVRAESQVVSLDEAVSRALARNPTVAVALEEIRRAEAIVLEARAPSLPTLTGNLTYLRLDNDRVLNGRVISAADQAIGNFNLAVPVIAPRNWATWSHAKDAVAVAQDTAAETRRQLAIAVGRTYLSLVAQHRVIEVTQRAVETARAHLDFAHQRFAGGYGTRVDEVRAAQELATVRSQLENAHVQRARLGEALGVLVGGEEAIDVAADVRLPEPPPLDVALDEAPRLRTDVRLLHQRLEAAHHLVRDQWTEYSPTVIGAFTPFLQDPPTLTNPLFGWQAQIALQIPLYDGGLRYGLGRERRALEREAQINVEGTLRQARSDVRTAVEELRRAQAALNDAQEASRLATEGLQLTNLAYQAGAATNIEVIDAERTARDADTAVATAEDAERQARLDLLIASGRFPR